MVFTGSQLIARSLSDIKVLGVGRHLTDRDAQVALVYLQELIDSWQIERLSIYTVARTSFTLVASTQTRTIGPSAQYAVTPKPIYLASAMVIPVGSTIEQPVHIWERQRWLAEPQKSLTDLVPRAVYMEPGVTTNVLNFWPIPTTPATLWLGLPTGLVGFADLTTSYTFPPGYHEAFRTELSKRLCRPFGKPIDEDLKNEAKLAFGRIQRVNDDGPPLMGTDPALSGQGGYYDVYADEYYRS